MGVHTNLLKFLFRTMRYMPFLLLFCLYSPISALPVLNAQDANVAAANTADTAAVSTAADNATVAAAPANGDEANAKVDCTCPTKEPSSETPKSDAVQASPQSADNSIAVNGQPFQAVSPAVRRKRQVPEAPAASVAVVPPPLPAVPVVTSLNIAPVSVSEGDLQAAAVAQESSSPKPECVCPSRETLQSAAVAGNPETMKAPEPALAPVYPTPATTTTVAPVDPYNQAPVVNPDLQAYAVAVDPNAAANPSTNLQAAEAPTELQAAAVAADPQSAADPQAAEASPELQAAAVAADPQPNQVATDLQAAAVAGFPAAGSADPQAAEAPGAPTADLQAVAVAAEPQAADDGEGSQALVKGPEGPSDLQAAAVAADPQSPVVATDLQVSAVPANPAEPQAAEASADPPPPEAAAVMSDPAVEGLPEQLLQQQPQPAISVSLV